MTTEPQVTAPEADSGSPSRPLRRDAERNRRLILEAAKAVFARRGLDASLDEVAKEAGLGVGTVYRRFPNRDALIDALYDDLVARVRRITEESATRPRAWDGLVHFVTAMLESQARDKSLRDVMIARHQDLDACAHQPEQAIPEMVRPLLHDLVTRAHHDGDLRPDVTPTDIAVLLVAAVGIVEFTAPVAPDSWRRQLSVILDGLRTRPDGRATVLAAAPLDDEQIEVCMEGWKYGSRQTVREHPSEAG